MRAHSAVCGLYFVRDAHASGLTHVTVDRFEVAGWWNDLPTNAGARFRDESAEPSLLASQVLNCLSDSIRILDACRGVAALVSPAVVVGNRHDVDPRRFALPS